MNLGIVTTLLGLAPAGTALGTALLGAALGRPTGLPLAALLGRCLPARRTSLGRHGSIDLRLGVRDNCNLRERPRPNTIDRFETNTTTRRKN